MKVRRKRSLKNGYQGARQLDMIDKQGKNS